MNEAHPFCGYVVEAGCCDSAGFVVDGAHLGALHYPEYGNSDHHDWRPPRHCGHPQRVHVSLGCRTCWNDDPPRTDFMEERRYAAHRFQAALSVGMEND